MNRAVLSALLLATVCACGHSASSASEPTSGLRSKLEALEALDRMDTRNPVPLLPMMADHQRVEMRDHLAAVQEILAALEGDDFAALAQSAGRIGSSESMTTMCTHMGAGALGFTEQALNFHHTADTIVAAAEKHDRAAVVHALAATLRTCTVCHAAFRQSVVDEETWTRLTSTPAPSGHAAGH